MVSQIFSYFTRFTFQGSMRLFHVYLPCTTERRREAVSRKRQCLAICGTAPAVARGDLQQGEILFRERGRFFDEPANFSTSQRIRQWVPNRRTDDWESPAAKCAPMTPMIPWNIHFATLLAERRCCPPKTSRLARSSRRGRSTLELGTEDTDEQSWQACTAPAVELSASTDQVKDHAHVSGFLWSEAVCVVWQRVSYIPISDRPV